jgi:O-antigen/teichoic acid export membrane protein
MSIINCEQSRDVLISTIPNLPQFVKNTCKLMLGGGLGQLVSFVAAPFIAKIYGPESFGEQSALLSVVGPLATLASMAFPIAIVFARTDDDALALSRLAFWGSLVISSIATLVLTCNDMWLMRRIGLEEIGPYGVLIPLLVVLTTTNMSSIYIMTRFSAFDLSAYTAVAAAVVGSLSKIALGVTNPGTLSLIAGNALGYLVGPLIALRLYLRKAAHTLPLSVTDLKGVAIRHRNFPMFQAPQNFIWAIAQAIPVIGLTAGFGPASAGHYAMAMALAGAPGMLIGGAIQSVLYPRLTGAVHSGDDTTRLLVMATLGLVALGAPFFLVIAFFGAPLFQALLGPEWRETGVFSALLIPWIWLELASRPAISLIPALGLQRGLLICELIGAAAKASAIMFGVFVLGNARWTVGSFSVVGALVYLLMIFWVVWKSRNSVEGRGFK